MSNWFKETPESLRMLAEERVILAASELIAEALESRGQTKSLLADSLNVKRSEISQRLSGRRNITMKSFASMLDALGYGVEFRLVDKQEEGASPVFHGAREMDWPAGNMRYTQHGHTPIRVIKGGEAA